MAGAEIAPALLCAPKKGALLVTSRLVRRGGGQIAALPVVGNNPCHAVRKNVRTRLAPIVRTLAPGLRDRRRSTSDSPWAWSAHIHLQHSLLCGEPQLHDVARALGEQAYGVFAGIFQGDGAWHQAECGGDAASVECLIAFT